jgi:16S rRNA (uracil1498-N3)-methyltransferase
MRRIHVPNLSIGEIDLPEPQAHHLRDVLRLTAGDTVQAFDADGSTATATLLETAGRGVRLRVESVEPGGTSGADNHGNRPGAALHLTVAAAVPKAARADWMIEKLSELGADVFVPLQTARSVVLPAGQNKYDRWARLATESARQSGGVGIMRIEPLAQLSDVIDKSENSSVAERSSKIVYFSTEPAARSIFELVEQSITELTILIGPEGGWSPEEISQFAAGSIEGIKLTNTILRVETAAISATAILKAGTTGRR